ncbi:MAG: hypothetical protein OSJ72_15395 [Lachnospiraceae bacterium]|nr:hypothetical protein [Lachnospiraceae bacterium]
MDWKEVTALKLIRLEWKKHNIGKQIRIAVITTVVLMLFMLMTARELETSETVEAYGKSMLNAALFAVAVASVWLSVWRVEQRDVMQVLC